MTTYDNADPLPDWTCPSKPSPFDGLAPATIPPNIELGAE